MTIFWAPFRRPAPLPPSTSGVSESQGARHCRHRGRGDSHTYGNTARMVDSWPYVAGPRVRPTSLQHGPGRIWTQSYFYLSKTKALTLKPKMIIGASIWATILRTHSRSPMVWTTGGFENSSDAEKSKRTSGRPAYGYRQQKNQGLAVSTLRHLSTSVPRGFWRQGKGRHSNQECRGTLPGLRHFINIPDNHILEAFRPKAVLFGLDQDNPNVREGMRITFELLKQMNEICRQNHVQFVVVVVPTKEMVFPNTSNTIPRCRWTT